MGAQRGRAPQSPTHPDAALIERLQSTLLAALRGLHDGQPYALLDFPWYANVGDSLLWLGARRALADATGRAPAYGAGQSNYSTDALAKALPKGTIYLLGGGNFGDLYPSHQAFRLRILREFPQHRVVQLPQSIHFTNAESEREIRHALTVHGNTVLMARDHPSLSAALTLGASAVHLVPDLAFGLGIRARPQEAHLALLALRRVDQESASDGNGQWRPAERTADWPAIIIPPLWRRIAHRLTRGAGRVPSPLPQRAQIAILDAMAARRVAVGERLLSSAHFVQTDRLHGHLMCLLLGIPHDVLDNSTGKIGAMIDTWTSPSTLLRRRPEAEARRSDS
ncbi:polysaccharide pyruvyl transferase family protein [Gemmatimonas sp.]|uniref:polysaccharide pyruvyl transferase family protein n=1 Tax=Gemmatimonas sp. TaxID=1962908 RepID=UPI0037C0F750